MIFDGISKKYSFLLKPLAFQFTRARYARYILTKSDIFDIIVVLICFLEMYMKNKYNKTIVACFIGYIVQSIVCVFVPLLFLTFEESYNIPVEKITLLISVTFIVQIITDLAATFFVDRVGYRICTVLAHVFAALGLLLLPILPEIMSDAFVGILIAVILYAVGGGLIEVVISPVVESCPSEHKDKRMSLLHSFFCWGSVGVIVISALYFLVFGIENWRYLSFIWAIISAFNAVFFMFVPLQNIVGDGEKGLGLTELISKPRFWLFFLIILCAGACEAGISQWASVFTEQSLGISKSLGDILGPAIFAAMMGLCRLLYGRSGENVDLTVSMTVCGALCIVSYLLVSLVPSPMISLLGMAMCGFSVGLMWPGTYSMASAGIERGGNVMFALLALGGDLGCVSGPAVVGTVSQAFGGNMRAGILCAALFPITLTLCMIICGRMYKKDKK